MTRPLAWALAGLALYGAVITLPFMGIEVFGFGHSTTLIAFPSQLAATGYWELGGLFLLFIIVFPSIKLLLLVSVLLGLRLPRPPRVLRLLFRWYAVISPWAMVEVFLVGFFVAYSRLEGLATIDIGTAVWGMAGLMLAIVAADATLDAEAVWEAIESRCPPYSRPVQHGSGHPIGCRRCGEVSEFVGGSSRCPRCGVRQRPRKPASLSRTWAFLIAASICAVGAYICPIMTATRFGRGSPTTIFAGMIELAEMGWWPIAFVVFIASITIPMFKLVALGSMAISVHRRSSIGLRTRTRIYRFVEVIGRWSMIDIFMVSILTALVQLGFLGEVRPDIGAIAFAAVVILTMFAAYSFDPRLMWDAATRRSPVGQALPSGPDKAAAEDPSPAGLSQADRSDN